MPTPPHKRLYSLRLRLLLSILGISTFLWLVSLAIMVSIAWHETNTVFDDALKKSASLLLQASEHTKKDTSLNKIDPKTTTDSEKKPDSDDIHYQIIQEGEVISHTQGTPLKPFIANFPKRKGFSDIQFNHDSWRIYVIRAKKENLEIQVGQSLEMRMEILKELAESLIVPALSLLLLLGLTCAFAIYYLLKPLHKMTEQLTKKNPQDLDLLPLNIRSIELSAITNALNGVLFRLDSALQNERRFTADAAHELRTPLAALGMQAQLLQRQHPTLKAPLQKLRLDINRCTHLIEHLLLLARLDPLSCTDQNALQLEPIDLPNLFLELKESFAYQANQQAIHLSYLSQVKTVYAHPEMLRILLRNLIDNALRYCPANTSVIISAVQESNQVILSVMDNGPGVRATELNQLTQRFFRILGSEQNGSGLGLSIVQRIADLHHANLSITTGEDNQGLTIKITFFNK